MLFIRSCCHLKGKWKLRLTIDILLKITFDSNKYQTTLGTAGEPSQKTREK
jgi:hypothetical protein